MPEVLGLVPLVGRSPLACLPFNGDALFLSAVGALSQVANPPVMVLTDPEQAPSVDSALTGYSAVVDLVESPRDDDRLRAAAERADVALVHDPLCPLVTPAWLRRCMLTASAGTATVAVRPVVDTIKAARLGMIAGTVDRDALRTVSSPVAVPAALMCDIPDLTATLSDLSALVQWLRERCDVVLAAAPSASWRIEDTSSMILMSSVESVGHRLRER